LSVDRPRGVFGAARPVFGNAPVRSFLVLLGALACGSLFSSAPARARAVRPLFEPTDLELEDAGVVDIDLQIGAVRSRGPWRAVLPDFELDLGILPNLELDVDGAYAIEGPSTGPFSFDHAKPDSLWPSVKLGLFDQHDKVARRAWALGVQVGPKIPVATASHGVGAESLLLIGRFVNRMHTVLNVGGFVDPSPDATSGRPVGIELGLDLDLDLDDINRFSLTGELSSVTFLSSDPNQLLATAGFTWTVVPALDLSIVGLWGFLAGSDRYGALLGVSPKFHLFRP
jgi:hypothetical protein